MTQRARLLAPVGLLLVGAALVWIASRMVWLDVVAFNDQSGEARRSLVGADWQPALVPLALGALAAVAAVTLVRGTGARAVGAVIVLLGLATGALLLSTVGDVDRDRVHSAVTGEQDLGRTNAGPGTTAAQTVPEWSEITEVSTRAAGPALTGAGALALIAAGAFPIARPARKVQSDSRYETPAARRGESEASGADTANTGRADTADTGRDLWRELDDGRDPTS
ncbi:TIGR02234 family membrane protein [Rhodococcus sp. IEGM 1408]|uniref:TIGR02234 family membrane protein n=1 Tax=Rhodococcus sp. IEGM 1408 TaxID=3082220 RepID=UPI00295306F2|nr:TIGR02234 family membrane protein [Rhodococcus sp. IEGM 1408]MDV8001761.1 TIGR02234 family membrane protein [Rhodococcus sp. IEGM 1408]